MSIIKRITRTYIIITTLIIVTFITMTRIYTKNYYKTEVQRIVEISSGVKREINDKIENIKKEGENFSKWVDVSTKLNEKFNSDEINKIVNIKEKIDTELVDSAFVIDKSGEFITSDENINTDREVITTLINNVKDKSKYDGFLKGKEEIFYTYKSTFIFDNEDFELFIIKKLEDVFLAYDLKVDGRTVSISKNIDINNNEKVKRCSGKEMFYQINSKNVQAYIPIKVDNVEDSYYITVNEVRKTLSSMKDFASKLVTVLILIFCIGNYFIYKTVKEKIINRIVKTNEELNNIIKSKNKTEMLKLDEVNDEITILNNDINSLMKTIRKSSDEITNNERKNSRLLSSMSNAYLYLALIEDDNGKVVDGVIEDFNKAATEIFNVDYSVIGRKLLDLKAENLYYFYAQDTFEVLNKLKYKGSSVNYNNLNLTENLCVNLNMNCVDDGYISIILNDVSELKKSSNELEKLVKYDDVTSLYSRVYLVNYLNKLIEDGEEFFTLFIDLDNFKMINDAIGHKRGDKILSITGEVLSRLNDENTVVGRFGGDEFIIARKGNEEDARSFAEETLRLINRRVKFNTYAYVVRATIGISVYPKHGDNVEKLIQYADIALYEGKAKGGNTYKLFSEEMLEEYELQGKLKVGIERGELEVFYQPVYNTSSQEIKGAEALVRWRTPNELITPNKFLEIAKRNGDIILIDDFVLREACKFCKERIDEGRKDFFVSVNMSYKYFMIDDFIEVVKSIIKTTSVDASALRLEITESELLRDYDKINKKFEELRSLGIKISLDDFGVGYSAFNYIRNLPIDIIKIDKSLVMDIKQDGKSTYIIDTLIRLCKNLNLDVICEGVESKEQLDILKNISCESIQGFYISEPVKKESFVEILKEKDSEI